MYLLDTDTIIYALKGDPKVTRRFEEAAAHPKALSVITYGELFYGAMKSAAASANLARVRRVAELFQVVEVSRPIVETFGSIKADLERRGRVVDDFDLVIAATALTLNYRLVTNNERHFRGIPGLHVENWAR
ncbi:MAG: nucleic acid-binding protein [candidate division NC10 bacterium RIFCSPLOWO2_02_FULL_66_22]|nr:MAG: nucleic acid-binding protein [candidate division NC10 bacterium RIFCSPLOWO2_02_FULL_66_22]